MFNAKSWGGGTCPQCPPVSTSLIWPVNYMRTKKRFLNCTSIFHLRAKGIWWCWNNTHSNSIFYKKFSVTKTDNKKTQKLDKFLFLMIFVIIGLIWNVLILWIYFASTTILLPGCWEVDIWNHLHHKVTSHMNKTDHHAW